ncbi:MAG: SulP family inorganic anion transporter, partial [Anaerolineales bacterium]
MRRLRAIQSPNWLADLGAGLTGAIAGAPQAMAFAIIAGVSPIYGLYTAIVSTIVGAVFNHSPYMTIGPTNALALVVGSALLPYEGAAAIDRLFVLTVLVGVFQFSFGILRLGDITRFVSESVMTGFITGAGCLIILGQLSELTGYEDAHGDLLVLRTLDLMLNLDAVHLPTLGIGVLALVMIWGLHHTRLRTVATLIALVATVAIVEVFDLQGVAVVRDMAVIP